MKRIKRMVATGLLCGLVVAGMGRVTQAASPAAADAGARVNINSASVDDLVRLPGIGPKLAQAIVDYRSAAPFEHAEDLRKVKGVGDKLYERLKDRITVGEAHTSRAGRGG